MRAHERESTSWAIYFITLIDDYSRYEYVYLLSHRYEALDVFKYFIAEVETQLERRVKILRIDRGREYLSNMFKMFCEEKGIQRQLTIPRTPQQTVLLNVGIKFAWYGQFNDGTR